MRTPAPLLLSSFPHRLCSWVRPELPPSASGRLQQHRLLLLPPFPTILQAADMQARGGHNCPQFPPGAPSCRKGLSLLMTTSQVLQHQPCFPHAPRDTALHPLCVPPTRRAHFYLRAFAHAIPAAQMLLFLRLRWHHLLREVLPERPVLCHLSPTTLICFISSVHRLPHRFARFLAVCLSLHLNVNNTRAGILYACQDQIPSTWHTVML